MAAHKEGGEESAEGEDTDNELILFTALKKLKMDTDCAHTVKKEECSETSLKHKPGVSEGSLKHKSGVNETSQQYNSIVAGTVSFKNVGHISGDDCSQFLQQLCLCDQAVGDDTCQSKPDKSSVRDIVSSSSSKNSFNLVQAACRRKPLLREARLKFLVNQRKKQLIHPSRLKHTSKTTYLNNNKVKALSTAVSLQSSPRCTVVSVGAGSLDKEKPASDKSRALFGEGIAGYSPCFSSLITHNKYHFKSGAKKDAMVMFKDYRENPSSTANTLKQNALLEPCLFTPVHREVSHAACSALSAPSLVSRPELSLERSCSQEARLDEMSVNELAAYFEDFIYIPKKMSSMAEMMYI